MSFHPIDKRPSRMARQSQRYAGEIVIALVLTLAATAVLIAAVTN